MKKRLLAFLMSGAMLLGSVPSAFAAEEIALDDAKTAQTVESSEEVEFDKGEIFELDKDGTARSSFSVDESGTYLITINSYDGFWVSFDDSSLFAKYGTMYANKRNYSAQLTAGKTYSFEVSPYSYATTPTIKIRYTVQKLDEAAQWDFCGDNVIWTQKDGTLTISGTGDMQDYQDACEPWSSKITAAVIEEGVTSIGSCSFDYCKELKSVQIPDSVTHIGKAAFRMCMKLEDVHIPDGVTRIEDCTFDDCDSLKNVKLPDSVKSIGKSAFGYCSGLETINIPDGVTEIGERAFLHCSKIKSITIPEGVTEIHKKTFYGCRKLKNLTIPRSVTKIDAKAFAWCTSLTSVKLPSGITSIEKGTFDECMKLKSITIPEGVTEIGENAFAECVFLKTVTIPKSVTSIENNAFYRAFRMKTVKYKGKKSKWRKIAIGEGNNYLTDAKIKYNA